MSVNQNVRRPASIRFLALLAAAAISVAAVPPPAVADVALVVVDVVAVAQGYRASELQDKAVHNSQNEEVGKLDDLIVGRDRVLFAIIQVGGFLGIGSRLIAVPYTSLQISPDAKRVVLPGASKEELRRLPEFKYR
jgi:hypothetical protein